MKWNEQVNCGERVCIAGDERGQFYYPFRSGGTRISTLPTGYQTVHTLPGKSYIPTLETQFSSPSPPPLFPVGLLWMSECPF